jgi:hypothetical protein
MIESATEACRLRWRAMIAYAVMTPAALAALLFLDGRLGPVSFTLRRAAGLVVLAVIVVAQWARARPVGTSGTSDGSEWRKGDIEWRKGDIMNNRIAPQASRRRIYFVTSPFRDPDSMIDEAGRVPTPSPEPVSRGFVMRRSVRAMGRP